MNNTKILMFYPEPLDDTAIRQLMTALHAALLNPAHRQAVSSNY